MEQWGPAFLVCYGISPIVARVRFSRALGCNRGYVLHYGDSEDDYPGSRSQ